MTTQETTPEMEKAPKRFTDGTFVRINVGDTVKGILKGMEYREEEKVTGTGKKKQVETVLKPYYQLSLVEATKLEVRKDEAEDFDKGALVKVQGKGSLHSDMKAFLAKDQGVDYSRLAEDDEAGRLDFSPLFGYRFEIKRLPNEQGRGKNKGTEFTRWEVLKSREKAA